MTNTTLATVNPATNGAHRIISMRTSLNAFLDAVDGVKNVQVKYFGDSTYNVSDMLQNIAQAPCYNSEQLLNMARDIYVAYSDLDSALFNYFIDCEDSQDWIDVVYISMESIEDRSTRHYSAKDYHFSNVTRLVIELEMAFKHVDLEGWYEQLKAQS